MPAACSMMFRWQSCQSSSSILLTSSMPSFVRCRFTPGFHRANVKPLSVNTRPFMNDLGGRFARARSRLSSRPGAARSGGNAARVPLRSSACRQGVQVTLGVQPVLPLFVQDGQQALTHRVAAGPQPAPTYTLAGQAVELRHRPMMAEPGPASSRPRSGVKIWPQIWGRSRHLVPSAREGTILSLCAANPRSVARRDVARRGDEDEEDDEDTAGRDRAVRGRDRGGARLGGLLAVTQPLRGPAVLGCDGQAGDDVYRP